MGTTTECIENILASGKTTLGRDQIQDAVEQVDDLRLSLVRQGRTDNLPARLREAVAEQAKRVEILAAAKRRNTALNVLAHDSVMNHVDSLVRQGISEPDALLALMEGTQQGVAGGRVSVWATKQAYAGRYVGAMLGETEKAVPHARRLIDDRAFNEDITREMWELREGGSPGSTGNTDAQTMAGVFARYTELARTEVNQRGGMIGKLDGWAGAQIHDDFKLLSTGEEKWLDTVLPLLDHERTFGQSADILALTRQEIAGLGGEHLDFALVGKRHRQAKQAVASLEQRQAVLDRLQETLSTEQAAHLERIDKHKAGINGNATVFNRLKRKAERLRGASDRIKSQQDTINTEQAAHLERIGAHKDGFLSAETEGAVSRHKAGVNESVTAFNRLKKKAESLRNAADRIKSQQETVNAHMERIGPTETENAISRRVAGINESAIAFNRLKKRTERLRNATDRIKGQREAASAAVDKFSRLEELLTLEKSMNDAAHNPREMLREVYTTIVTGVDNATRRITGPTRPGNIARSMTKSRVLHFKDADAAIAYNRQFGHGGAISSMVRHQERMSDLAAQMEVFGPNPDLVMKRAHEEIKHRVRNDDTKSPSLRKKLIDKMDNYALETAFDEMSGVTMKVASINLAQVSSSIRAVQSMAKLGQALLSSVLPDLATSGVAAKFRGGSIFGSMARQVATTMKGRPKGEQAEIAYSLNEGYKGMIGAIANRFHAEDGMPGATSRLTHKFFQWSGLTWWTEVSRTAVARAVASELAGHASRSFDAMNPKFRHALSLHGIDAAKWDAIRQGDFRVIDGQSYMTPDRMRGLPDRAIDPLIQERLSQLSDAVRNDPVKWAEAVEKARDRARFDLEMSIRRFVSDETGYAILEPDAATRRYTLQGSRPGTITGEFWRLASQFKSFPVAFANRVVGRGLYGHAGTTKGERMLNGLPHMGQMLALTAAAGYGAIMMKDILRGYGPRGMNLKTLMASLTQGGGLGIWGDFLFGEVNRFGNSPLETLAGPTIGAGADTIGLFQKAREGDTSAGQSLNLILQNTPFVNLWYTRPVLDILFLNSIREGLSPFGHRQEFAGSDENLCRTDRGADQRSGPPDQQPGTPLL